MRPPAWLAVRQAEGAASDSTPSLAEWLQSWTSDQPFAKPSTQATYRCHVDRHISPALGDLPIADLSRSDIAGFVRKLADQNLSPATVHRIVATLRSALGAAVRDQRLATNPVQGVQLPSVPARPHCVWTAQQAWHFLAACPDDAIAVLLGVALMTGMRRGPEGVTGTYCVTISVPKSKGDTGRWTRLGDAYPDEFGAFKVSGSVMGDRLVPLCACR